MISHETCVGLMVVLMLMV